MWMYVYVLATLITIIGLRLVMSNTQSDTVDRPTLPGRLTNHIDLLKSMLSGQGRYIDDALQTIQNCCVICTNTLEAVRADSISCVVNKTPFKRRYGAIALPEKGAFAPRRSGSTLGDAILQQQKILHVENKLLDITKQQLRLLEENASRILLLTRTTHGDSLKSKRVTRNLNAIKRYLMTTPSDLVVACAEQRERLKHSHPALSHYEFFSESIHDMQHIPRYEFGEHQQGIERVTTSVYMDPANMFVNDNSGAELEVTSQGQY